MLAARAQHLGCAGVIEQCKQQMLHGDELVALLAGLNKGHVQADFQFLGNPRELLCACVEGMTVDRDQRPVIQQVH